MAVRDPWFDNAKMVLVTLAVVGHAWGLLLPESDTNNWLYYFLYLWHMPAFIMVSGYFSRSFDWSSRRMRALVGSVLVPFVIYQAALVWFQVALGGDVPPHPFLDPVWPLWYLVALAAWRLVTPAFLAVPAWVAVLASFAVSLLGGVVDVEYFSLSRVLGMLPFFVIGLVATPERIAWLRSATTQQAGVVVLLLTLVVTYGLDTWTHTTWVRTSWLYYRPYDVFQVGLVEGALVRGAVLAVGVGCALGALALVPRVHGWFTQMGSATMIVFLVHAFVVRAVAETDLVDWTTQHEAVGRLVVVGGAVALSMALASPVAIRYLGPLVDPVGAWRDRKRATEPVAATQPDPARLR